MEILERVRATLRERRLLPPDGGLVIVGYSGGADSTALLHLLTRLQDEFHIHLHAAHLHHGMRPEADNDVRVCQSVCEQLQVPLHIERVDIARAGAGGAFRWKRRGATPATSSSSGWRTRWTPSLSRWRTPATTRWRPF